MHCFLGTFKSVIERVFFNIFAIYLCSIVAVEAAQSQCIQALGLSPFMKTQLGLHRGGSCSGLLQAVE